MGSCRHMEIKELKNQNFPVVGFLHLRNITRQRHNLIRVTAGCRHSPPLIINEEKYMGSLQLVEKKIFENSQNIPISSILHTERHIVTFSCSPTHLRH